jgi:MFS family permease
LGVICVAMFISAMDMTIVNVALPDLSNDLGAGIGELQWVLDAFLVSLAACSSSATASPIDSAGGACSWPDSSGLPWRRRSPRRPRTWAS